MYLLKEQLQIKEKHVFIEKGQSTDMYINWNSHAPTEWKTVTLRNIVKRSKTAVCTTTHQKSY